MILSGLTASLGTGQQATTMTLSETSEVLFLWFLIATESCLRMFFLPTASRAFQSNFSQLSQRRGKERSEKRNAKVASITRRKNLAWDTLLLWHGHNDDQAWGRPPRSEPSTSKVRLVWHQASTRMMRTTPIKRPNELWIAGSSFSFDTYNAKIARIYGQRPKSREANIGFRIMREQG